MDTLKDFITFGTENPQFITRMALQLINHAYQCQQDNQWIDFEFKSQEGLTESLKKSQIWKNCDTPPSFQTHSISQLEDLMKVPIGDLNEIYSSLRETFMVGKQMLNNFEHRVKKFPLIGKYLSNVLKENPYALVREIRHLPVICDGQNVELNSIKEHDFEMFSDHGKNAFENKREHRTLKF